MRQLASALREAGLSRLPEGRSSLSPAERLKSLSAERRTIYIFCWLPGYQPRGQLFTVTPQGVTVSGFSWPIYGPGGPQRHFMVPIENYRDQFSILAAVADVADRHAFLGDGDVLNVPVFPHHNSRRSRREYELEDHVLQLIRHPNLRVAVV